MSRIRIVVVGALASNPYAGMSWMHMQIAAGLRRLGHDVYYFETTSAWPYDPVQNQLVCSSDYALTYLRSVLRGFGLEDAWAYRRSYLDGEWFGMPEARARDLLKNADLVMNVTGATRFAEEGLDVGRTVYLGTDPIVHEIAYQQGSEETHVILKEHDDIVTYGENLGSEVCPIPPLPGLVARTRQPVLLDSWKVDSPPRKVFTTVGNWKQEGRDLEFAGDTYRWSKHHEFLKFIDLPQRTESPIELAMNLTDESDIHHGEGVMVRAKGLEGGARTLLETNGWHLTNACDFTTDPWSYRDYIRNSYGEFTVARDLNVSTRSGWFSERSACYLAAGRPVITQDTGFGRTLPTGRGLFAFNTMDDILSAFDEVRLDYDCNSRAAREIAEEYFRAETVLSKLLEDLGV